MKKLLILLFVLALSVSMLACSRGSFEPNLPPPPPVVPTTDVDAFVYFLEQANMQVIDVSRHSDGEFSINLANDWNIEVEYMDREDFLADVHDAVWDLDQGIEFDEGEFILYRSGLSEEVYGALRVADYEYDDYQYISFWYSKDGRMVIVGSEGDTADYNPDWITDVITDGLLTIIPSDPTFFDDLEERRYTDPNVYYDDGPAYLPERTTFQAPLPNTENAIAYYGDSSVMIPFRNTLGLPISLNRVASVENTDIMCDNLELFVMHTDLSTPFQVNEVIQIDEDFVLIWDCDDVTDQVVGDMFRADLSFDYKNEDTGIVRTHTGSVMVRMQEQQ